MLLEGCRALWPNDHADPIVLSTGSRPRLTRGWVSAINDAGVVVSWITEDCSAADSCFVAIALTLAVEWTADHERVELDDPSHYPNGVFYGQAAAINASGAVVGRTRDDKLHAVRFR